MQIDLAALPDDPAVLQRMLQEVVPELQAENEKLWQLIQRLLRHRYGPRSEKLDLDQLQLVLEDEEQSAAESDAAKDAAEPTERRRRTEVTNRNRGALPAHLPRYEVVIDIESKECPCCGGALHVIGDDRTEMLDLVPAQLRVKVVCRPRYGCRTCEGAVVQAPAPERPIDGGMATEALIAHVVVSKFCDALPLHRQAQMLKRQGITLDRSTLSAWVGRACWWLTPLYELVLGTVLSSDKVFADETTLPVLDPGRGKTKTGRLWCYAVDDRPWAGPTHPAAAYVYSEDRRGEHPAAHLAAFRGTLQVDGYAGFSNLVEARKDASIQLAFCWAHARRPFYEFYTSTQSPLAAEVLARIAKLYEIEADIRGQPPDVRQAIRQLRSRPLVEDLHRLATGPPAARAWLVRPGESHAICIAPLGRADPVSRRRTTGDGHQRRRARHQAGGEARVIVHLLFKYLETLEVECWHRCDTGALYARPPPPPTARPGRWHGSGTARPEQPARREGYRP